MQSAAASSNYLFVRIAEKAVQVIVEALELRWLDHAGLFLGILGSVGRDKLAQLLRAHILAVVILRSGGFRGLVRVFGRRARLSEEPFLPESECPPRFVGFLSPRRASV